jgi:uncharacterized protein (DUF1697 family)
MGSRGRTSVAELSVVTPENVESMGRPVAPVELSGEQAAEWVAVVNRMPAEWFPRETHAMLVQYCRHAVACRRISELIKNCESAEEFDIKEYDRLLKMQDRESRGLSSLATRMRISQQSSYDKQKKKPAGSARPPWEFQK